MKNNINPPKNIDPSFEIKSPLEIKKEALNDQIKSFLKSLEKQIAKFETNNENSIVVAEAILNNNVVLIIESISYDSDMNKIIVTGRDTLNNESSLITSYSNLDILIRNLTIKKDSKESEKYNNLETIKIMYQ